MITVDTLRELAKKALESAVRWGLNRVAAVVGPVLLPFILSRVPALADALNASVGIPVWSAISAGLLLMSLAVVAVWLLRRLRAEKDSVRRGRARSFRWSGLEWRLGPDFWTSYEWITVRNMREQQGLLLSCVRHPFCPKCARDLSEHLTGQKCDCGYGFSVGLTGLPVSPGVGVPDYVMERIKLDVYREAQAAAMRGDLH